MPLPLRWEELQQLCQPDGGIFAVDTLDAASRFCFRWARQHYENFPVASLVLPARTRPHVAHLYAFARLADDIADNPVAPSQEKLHLLNTLEANLLEALRRSDPVPNPVLRALVHTLRSTGLPLALLRRLLIAFRYDAAFTPFRTWQQLEWYCHHSANPIGEALLFLHGSCHPRALCASNSLCTALQVLNFWQDLGLDLKHGRCSLPLELLQRHGVHDAAELWENSPKLRSCLHELSQYIAQRLRHAATMHSVVRHRRLRLQASLTLAAAHVLHKRLQDIGEEVLRKRPHIGLRDAAALVWKTWKHWRH